jgi:hypothetical protein
VAGQEGLQGNWYSLLNIMDVSLVTCRVGAALTGNVFRRRELQWSVVKRLWAELVQLEPVKWRFKNQTPGTWFSIVRVILILAVMNKRHTTGSIQADHSVSTNSKICRSVKLSTYRRGCASTFYFFTRSESSSRQLPGIHDHDLWTFVEYPVTLHWNCCRLFFFWRDSPPPPWAMASSFMRFLHHTQRRTTIGRTPLDEWSARRRDLYLTTLTTNIHDAGGIGTNVLSRRAAANFGIRPRGHWERRSRLLETLNSLQWSLHIPEWWKIVGYFKLLLQHSPERHLTFKNRASHI